MNDINLFIIMLILSSCLAYNISYSGYCDENSLFNNCCSDLADIGCHPSCPVSSSPIILSTLNDTLGSTESEGHTMY